MIEVAGVVARLGFRVDDDGAQRFERKVRGLREDARKPVVAELKGDLEARDLDLYAKKLEELQTKTRRRDAFKAHLGADFDPRAFNAYERESRKVQKSTDDNVRAQGRLRTAFGSISSAGLGMFAAAGGGYAIYSGFKSIVAASGDAEASMAKVRTMVENAGIDFDKHAEQIDRTIQAHSRLSGFDDEDLAESFGNMIRTTGNLNEAFRLNAIAADIARTKGTDLAGAQSLVARVANGAFNGLKRLGLSITPVTKAQDELTKSAKGYTVEQMRAAKEQDKTATAQKAIALLQRTFAGQARAYGQTQRGALDRVNVAWENLQETIGEKLGPSIARTANRLARFITGMAEGRGKGGEFADRLREIWDRVVDIYEALRDAERWLTNFYDRLSRGAKRTADDILGIASSILGAFADIAAGGAKLKIPGMKGISDDLHKVQNDLDKTREKLRDTGEEANKVDLSKVRRENRQTAKAFAEMAKDGGGSLRDIARTTRRRSDDIRKDLGGNSEEGKKALRNNFREAMDAVHRQMDRGKTTTERGMRAIRGYLEDELRVYGLDIAEGKKLGGKHPFADTLGATHPFAGKAGGGWIGAPGQVGQDTVPAMLAPGEAVLNRHQQAVIEGLLGGGFLDGLFAKVSTPHYMARGGIVPVPGFPGESAASSVIPKILQIARQFALTLTDAFGPGHKSPGHTRFGTAADFAGPDRNMDRAVQALVRAGYLVGYDGRFGSQAWPGHGPSSAAGANAHLHVELGGKGGAISVAQIARRIVRGGGQVGRAVQGALDIARGGAQSLLERATAGAVSTPVGGGGAGGWSKGALAGLWRSVNGRLGDPNLMAAIALAESGGRAGIVNSIGAGGLWQIHPPEPDYLDPRTNAAIAGRKLRSQGLRAWEAYTNGSYRQYLARGGRAGVAGKAPPIDDKTMGWMQSVWGRFAPMLGQSPSTKVRDLFKYTEGKGLFVGVDGINPRKGEFGLMWPKWLGKPNKSLTQLFIHEMAHRFQKTGQTGSYRLAEGGAEAFARRVMASQFGGPVPSTTYAGLADWVTKHKGEGWINYSQFGRRARARGGFVGRAVQYLNGGGRPRARASMDFHSGVSEESHAGPVQGFLLKANRRTLKHRIGDYENFMGAVETTRKKYSIVERLYNRIDESSLVNEQTGEVNAAAVQEKADRILQMILLAGQIVHYLEEARKVARRVVRSYKAIVTRLRGALKHAKKKDRSGIKAQLGDAIAGRDEYQGIVADLGFDITNARFDWEDLGHERDELLATKGTTPEAAPGPTADETAVAEQERARADVATRRADIAEAALSAFTSSGDIGAGGRNAYGAVTGMPGGPGAAGYGPGPGGWGAPVIYQEINTLVPGTAEQYLAVGNAAVVGIGFQALRRSPRVSVGP